MLRWLTIACGLWEDWCSFLQVRQRPQLRNRGVCHGWWPERPKAPVDSACEGQRWTFVGDLDGVDLMVGPLHAQCCSTSTGHVFSRGMMSASPSSSTSTVPCRLAPNSRFPSKPGLWNDRSAVSHEFAPSSPFFDQNLGTAVVSYFSFHLYCCHLCSPDSALPFRTCRLCGRATCLGFAEG